MECQINFVSDQNMTSAHTPARIEWLDFLRVLATASVVILHVSNSNWFLDFAQYPAYYPSFVVFNFYESLVHWGVPIFVMISGALFLGKNLSLRRIYHHYIARLVLAFGVWSLIYALADYFTQGLSLSQALANLVAGPSHLWYLFLIIGLYAIIPFLQRWLCDDKSETLLLYFVALALIFGFGLHQWQDVLDLVAPGSLLQETVQFINYRFCFYFVCGYTSYFLLGFYLSRRHLSRGQRRMIYALALLGAIATTGLSWAASTLMGQPVNIFFEYLTLNIWASALGIFVFARYHAHRLPRFVRRAIAWIAPYTFGIYLVHPLIFAALSRIGINTWWLTPVFSVPVVCVMVFFLSLLASMLIRQIPTIGKLIA